MSVVVTGSSGFIGLHLVEHLRSQGKRVIAIDRVPPKKPIDDVVYQSADLGWNEFHYPDDPPDELYHLAAEPWSIVKGDSWFKGSYTAFHSNAIGTYEVLKEVKPKHIVFSSTANVYGEGRKHVEHSPIVINSQYGYSKWVAEEIIRKSGYPYTIFRFGTVVGERGRTFPNRLVWCAVHNVPVDIFNMGKTARSYIDVRDIVKMLAMGKSFNAVDDNTYNLGSETEISGMRLVRMVAEIAPSFGVKLRYNLVKFSAPGYVAESTLSCNKMKAHYGWEPENGLRDTLERLFKHYLHDENVEPPSWDKV